MKRAKCAKCVALLALLDALHKSSGNWRVLKRASKGANWGDVAALEGKSEVGNRNAEGRGGMKNAKCKIRKAKWEEAEVGERAKMESEKSVASLEHLASLHEFSGNLEVFKSATRMPSGILGAGRRLRGRDAAGGADGGINSSQATRLTKGVDARGCDGRGEGFKPKVTSL
jgi:hypothetical protein